VVVFVNKVDLVDDPDLIDLVELEARDLLTKYGFDGAATPFVRGNARAALENPGDPQAARCIDELLGVLDTPVPAPVRLVDRPFLLAVEGVHVIEGRGTVATGKIEQGAVRVGQKVEVVGLGGLVETVVTSIQAFHQAKEEAFAGENVGLLLRGVRADELQRGQVVTAPRSVQPRARFTAEVYVLRKDEGGRSTPFFAGYRPQFHFRTADVTGEVALAAGIEMVAPGDNARVEVGLDKPIAIEPGSRFALREGGRTVGSGVVTRVLE
jgi:elongation factor Tu